MSVWRRIEEVLWTGPVEKDYGAISETGWGPAGRKISVLLTRRKGQRQFVIRMSYRAVLAASVSYLELDREAALKLKVALDDALGQMQALPPGH